MIEALWLQLQLWLAQVPPLPPAAVAALSSARKQALVAVQAFAAPEHELYAIRGLQLVCAAYLLRGFAIALAGACAKPASARAKSE